MRVVRGAVALVALLMVVPAGAAEATLWFVGDGTDEVVARPSASTALTARTNHPMSLEGHGGQTSTHLVVLGNSIDQNGFLPTFVWSDAPLALVADDVLTVHHFAAVTGGAAAPAGCGLFGILYNEAGDIVKQTTVLGGGVDYKEFVFEFTGITGEFPVLRFQAVQNSNQCGWATIEHIWGSETYPGRLVVPARALFGQDEPGNPDMLRFEDLEGTSVEHTFANATSDTYQLNLTTDLVNSTAHFAWSAAAGAVNATLTDANGTVVFHGTFEGNGTLAHLIMNATAGAWNLTLAYAGFNGTMAFELTPAFAMDPAPSAPADNGTVETNGTATLDSLPKETPVPVVVPVLGLVATMVLRRRR